MLLRLEFSFIIGIYLSSMISLFFSDESFFGSRVALQVDASRSQQEVEEDVFSLVLSIVEKQRKTSAPIGKLWL